MKNTAVLAAAASTTNLSVSVAGDGNQLNGTSPGPLSIDSASLSVDDLVLIKDQSDNTQNGLYRVTSLGSSFSAFVLNRDTDISLQAGLIIVVVNGSSNAGTMWVNQNELVESGVTSMNFIGSI